MVSILEEQVRWLFWRDEAKQLEADGNCGRREWKKEKRGKQGGDGGVMTNKQKTARCTKLGEGIDRKYRTPNRVLNTNVRFRRQSVD